jgi:hypothetical protein
LFHFPVDEVDGVRKEKERLTAGRPWRWPLAKEPADLSYLSLTHQPLID